MSHSPIAEADQQDQSVPSRAIDHSGASTVEKVMLIVMAGHGVSACVALIRRMEERGRAVNMHDRAKMTPRGLTLGAGGAPNSFPMGSRSIMLAGIETTAPANHASTFCTVGCMSADWLGRRRRNRAGLLLGSDCACGLQSCESDLKIC
jgi:hypothetical protein